MNTEQNLFDWLDEAHNHSEQEAVLLVVPMDDEDSQKPEQVETAEDNPTISEQEESDSDTQSHIVPKLWTFINDTEGSEKVQEAEHEEIQHTVFSLNLDEPPPELWTRINSPTADDTEDEEEYEQGMSLQGAAYIPKKTKHGKNFTQRLQKTLQGRKERAARLKEEEEEHAPHHPYIYKAVIMCGTLIIALVLSWVCLWFMQDGVAAYLERAREEQQTVKPEVIERIEPEEIILPPVQSEVPPEPEPVIVPIAPAPHIMTFDEALTEGNNAYNIGMYSNAVRSFHRALSLREDDIRPYIGLCASYRAKGMYFDAKRLLTEARIKFGRNPAIEMEQYYLRRE